MAKGKFHGLYTTNNTRGAKRSQGGVCRVSSSWARGAVIAQRSTAFAFFIDGHLGFWSYGSVNTDTMSFMPMTLRLSLGGAQ